MSQMVASLISARALAGGRYQHSIGYLAFGRKQQGLPTTADENEKSQPALP